MVSDTSLFSAILSVYTAQWQPRQQFLFTATEGPFEEKNGKALVEVYSPAPGFGLSGRRRFLKSGITLKEKEKVCVSNLVFLHCYLYSLEQCDSRWEFENGGIMPSK